MKWFRSDLVVSCVVAARRVVLQGAVFSLALLTWTPNVHAQTSYDGNGVERPSMQAVSLTSEPDLDGDVLNDDMWRSVPAATGFVQTRPFSGAAATERTEVRIGYTAETLFIGIVCFDREPNAIIVSDSRRDAPLDDSDSFQVIFDTFGDQQNGFIFGTNPAGIEFDAQIIRGGSSLFGGGGGGGRFQSAVSSYNLNWDAAWRVAATTGDFGWSAEMAIPFRSLRYPSEEIQTWGVNFQRNIRRRNEQSFWAPLEQQMSLERLTEAGQLTDMAAPAQRNLKLIPYVLGEATRPGDESLESSEDLEVGLDLKVGITQSLTLDATYNTDFAQVEVDEQQVNLDRFNLFFPEKRPFFLENAGLFSVGSSGEVDLFFSRRIGLSSGGTQLPIDGGLRLSGKVGKTNLGFLAMQTDEEDGFQANRYGVARVNREFRNRSSVGGIFVTREGTGSLAASDDENQTLGLDFSWGIGTAHTVSGFVAQTDTPGRDGDDHAFKLGYSHASPKWRAFIEGTEVAEDFNPEVGFLARTEFRKAAGFIMRPIRFQNAGSLHELRPHISYTGFWDLDDFQETQFVHVDNHTEWRNGYELHTGMNFTKEGVREAFEISPGVVVPPGEYSHDEAQVVFITNQGSPYSYSNRVVVGGFFGGDRVSVNNTVRARWGEALTSELTWSYNNVNLPVGDFDVNLGRLRVSYSLTPRVLLQTLLQYNDRTDQTSVNLRFSWLRDANTGLFVVYNEIDEFGMRQLIDRPDRRLIIKYSHLFDVFRR